MVAFDNLQSIDWDSVVKELFPLVINKFALSPKQITGKKIWEKIKEVKLCEMGLSEAIVERVHNVMVNNSGVWFHYVEPFHSILMHIKQPLKRPPSMIPQSETNVPECSHRFAVSPRCLSKHLQWWSLQRRYYPVRQN
jgi:hypothetical protein